MKLNRTRSVTSLQPDERNGHKPAVVTQFWGNKAVALRGTSRGPGKRVVVDAVPEKKLLWWEDLRPVDPVTLKEIKLVPPKKAVKPQSEKPKLTLDALVSAFQARRSQ